MKKLIIIALFLVMLASITFAPPDRINDNLYEPCESGGGSCTPAGTYVNGTIYNVSVYWWNQFWFAQPACHNYSSNLQYALNTTTLNDSSAVLNITRAASCPAGANITIVDEYCVPGTLSNLSCMDLDDGTIWFYNSTFAGYPIEVNVTFEVLICDNAVDKLWDFRQELTSYSSPGGCGGAGKFDNDWVEGWNISEAGGPSGDTPEYANSRTYFTLQAAGATPTGVLNITLWNPVNTSINVTQNLTFIVNASITCLGGECNNTNMSLWYNLTNNNYPDYIMNSTTGDRPFYNFSGDVIQLCGNMTQDQQCNASWTINATGYAWSSWYLNVTANSSNSQQNSTSNFQVNITLLPTPPVPNTAPNITYPTIIPSTVYSNDTLNCSATPSDDENITLYINFTWYDDGIINNAYNSLQTCTNETICYTGIFVSPTDTTAGENWTCKARAWDAIPPSGLNSTWRNISTIIQNITTNPLILYDAPDPANITQQIKFMANYTETNNSAITSATCNVSFNISGSWTSPISMNWNATSELYDYNRTFTNADIVNWTVECDRIDYEYKTNTTNVTIQRPIGILNLTLWLPENISTNVTQNTTFIINGSVTCLDGYCDDVNTSTWYNLTSNTYPNYILNSTEGDYPFYNTSGKLIQLCGDLNANDQCNVSWVVNATGYAWSSWYLNITFNSSNSQENSTINFQVNITLPPVPIGVLNVTLLAPNLAFNITQNTTFIVNASVVCLEGSCSNVNASVWYNLTASYPNIILNATQGDYPFYNTTGEIMQLCGNMTGNQQCNVSWVVNATGLAGSGWLMNVTFNSSDSTQNSTINFQVNITLIPVPACPPSGNVTASAAPDNLFCNVFQPSVTETDMYCGAASEGISYYCSMVFNYYGGFSWICKRLD